MKRSEYEMMPLWPTNKAGLPPGKYRLPHNPNDPRLDYPYINFVMNYSHHYTTELVGGDPATVWSDRMALIMVEIDGD